jgi:LPXTG-motif cell wall-anchored protein
MDAAGGSVGKRLVPILAGLVVVMAIGSILRRRKKRRSIRHDAD